MALIGWMRPLESDPDMVYQRQALAEAGCAPIFSDTDQSFAELLAALSWSDTVVVTRFECFGQSLESVLQNIAQVHEECAFVRSLEQGLDSGKTDTAGKTLINVLGIFAELSRNLGVSDPDKAAIETPARRPKGRGGRKPVISDEIKEAIKAAVAAGESQYSQAKKYGISRTSVLRMMRGEQ